MPGRPECPCCDFADRPEVCHCLATGNERLCTLKCKLGRSDYGDLIHRLTTGEMPTQAAPVMGAPMAAAPMRVAAAPDPRLALIAKCPDRGSVLPHTLQPPCGCAELTECRAGKGSDPGKVCLSDCLICKSAPPIDTPVPSGHSERAITIVPTGDVEG